MFGTIVLEVPITKRFLYAMFYNPFVHWKVRHISCAIEASNAKSLHLCQRLGFTKEGCMREAAVDGEDIIMMGMLKRECRYL